MNFQVRMMGLRTVLGGVVCCRLLGRCANNHWAKFTMLDSTMCKSLPLLTQVGTISDRRNYPVEENGLRTVKELAAFAQKVKDWRCQHQIGQKEVAKEIGVSPAHFGHFETTALTVNAMQNMAKLINQWWSENYVPDSLSKALRWVPSDKQVAVLEESFAAEPNPSNQQRKVLARTLELPEKTVKQWYQNKRRHIKSVRHLAGDTSNMAVQEMKQFATEFRQRRARLGISQKDIGIATGKYSDTRISEFESLRLSLSVMRSMQGTLLETIEEAEAKMVSNKNRRQKIVGGPGIIYYLSEDKKEQLVKLVEDNQNKQPKDFVPTIAKEMDLPEKTVYNFVCNSRRRRSVKQIVDDEKDTCKILN